jgi:hypothetical protein
MSMMLTTAELMEMVARLADSVPCPQHGTASLSICLYCQETIACEKCRGSRRGVMGQACQCWNDD